MACDPSSIARELEGSADLPDWLRGPADNSDLPEFLQRVAATIGREGALRLAAAFGGTILYLPKRPSGSDDVSRTLGEERARTLCAHLCLRGKDRKVRVPFGPFTPAAMMRRAARQLIAEGRSNREIRAELDISAPVLTDLRRELQSGAAPASVPTLYEPSLDIMSEGRILARAAGLDVLAARGGELPDWLQGPADNSDLPLLLQEFAEVIGRAKTLLLAGYIGGMRLYFPRKPPADHILSKVIGHESALKLCEALATSTGIELELPLGPMTFLSFRAARMRAYILAGVPNQEIARRVGVTRRTVSRTVAQLRAQGIASRSGPHGRMTASNQAYVSARDGMISTLIGSDAASEADAHE